MKNTATGMSDKFTKYTNKQAHKILFLKKKRTLGALRCYIYTLKEENNII